MSLWGVHVGLAGAVTALAVARTGLSRWERRAVVLASGFWAVIPDLYHFVPGTRSWYKPLVHDSALANVVWLHGVIDRLDPGDRVAYSLVMWLVFLAVFVWVERRVGRRE